MVGHSSQPGHGRLALALCVLSPCFIVCGLLGYLWSGKSWVAGPFFLSWVMTNKIGSSFADEIPFRPEWAEYIFVVENIWYIRFFAHRAGLSWRPWVVVSWLLWSLIGAFMVFLFVFSAVDLLGGP